MTPSLSPKWDGKQPGAGRHGDARVRERRGRLLSRAAGRPGARAGGRHLPALARPAERHAEGRLGAGRGRGRRAAPLDAALPPGRRRARRCRPAKPRRRQSLLARPLHRAPRQRRPPAAHHGDQGGDRRGEPARRPRTAPARPPAEPGQPDGPGLGPVGAGERRLPAGPRSGGHRRSRPDDRARRHPAADQLDARALFGRHDHGSRPGDGRGAPTADGWRAAISMRCSRRSTRSCSSSPSCRGSRRRT